MISPTISFVPRMFMICPLRAAALAIVVLVAPSLSFGQNEPLPKAETILDRYIEVTGGKEKYEKLKSMILTAEVNVLPAYKLQLKSYHVAPDRMYVLLESPNDGLTQQGYDMGIAWERTPSTGPRIRSGPDKEMFKRQAQFNPELRWRELYKEATTVGIEEVNNKPAYRVELIPMAGRAEHQFYDKETGSLIRTISTVESEKGTDEPLEQLNYDYKETDGIVSAKKILQVRGSQKVLMTIEKVEYNASIPDDRFDPPSDVKALLEKEKTEKPEVKKPEEKKP